VRRNAAKVGVDQMLGNNSGRVRRHAQRPKNLADGTDQHLRLDRGHEIVFNAAGNVTGKSTSFCPPSLRATSGPVHRSLDVAQDPDAGGITLKATGSISDDFMDSLTTSENFSSEPGAAFGDDDLTALDKISCDVQSVEGGGMTGIVLQLQELAADGNTSIGELIRRARMVATKLKLTEFNVWLGHELHGYPADSEVPDYRMIDGDLRARNPMNGVLMPVRFDAELTERISRVAIQQPIGTLEELLKAEAETLQVPLSPRELAFVHRHMDEFHREWVVPFLLVSPTQVTTIVEGVRSTILDWALELESKGIMGNGMTFSADEQKRAAGTHVQIGSFQGILGDVSHSSVSQNLEMKVSRNDFESLRSLLVAMQIPEDEVDELHSALDADKKPMEKAHFGERVSGWIGGVAGKIASGAYKLALDGALDRMTRAIWQYYGF
jgi:hypothetical protein